VRIDHPVRFMGRGTVIVEDCVVLGYPLASATRSPILLEPREDGAVVHIGSSTTIVNGTEIIARERVEIGRHCLIGPNCVLIDSDFHGLAPGKRGDPGTTAPVRLCDNVWLGSEVMVLKGVEIGQDAVVGARAVVSQSVPAGSIVVSPRPVAIGSVYER
jgi:maltose O-acetyltransferase